MNATACHIEKVMAVSHSNSAAAESRLSASWRRSIIKHGLDPGRYRGSFRISDLDLNERREKLEILRRFSERRLDQLFSLVGSSGCGVFLTDREGVVLDQRSKEADERAFLSWGLWPGVIWSEAVEGTNGIGTCLEEERRVTIHREEHFYTDNIAMSCMGVPIFGPDGDLLAALDVSSARADQTAAFNDLISAMVVNTAAQVEADIFRASFPKARIMIADVVTPTMTALLAVDQDDIIIGATRSARRHLAFRATGALTPQPAVDVFGRDDGLSGFDRAQRAAVLRALIRSGGNASAAAKALGIGRATLYRRMRRIEIGKKSADLSRS